MKSKNNNNAINVKDITLIALMTTILFVQEQILTFIPNVQLTVFFLVLYSKKFGLLKTTTICLIHVVLDNFVMGSFNLIYMPFMFIGWVIIPISLNTVFKNVNSNIILAFLGIAFSISYSWIYIIPNCIVLQVDFITYLLADIIWEILLATSSFLTILLLYKPCSRKFDKYIIKKEISN